MERMLTLIVKEGMLTLFIMKGMLTLIVMGGDVNPSCHGGILVLIVMDGMFSIVYPNCHEGMLTIIAMEGMFTLIVMEGHYRLLSELGTSHIFVAVSCCFIDASRVTMLCFFNCFPASSSFFITRQWDVILFQTHNKNKNFSSHIFSS